MPARQVRKLLGLKAIGTTSSWLLVNEMFGWRRFKSRRQLASFTGSGKRMKKIGIVALARKLVVALWRYLEKGIPPEGAILVAWHTKVGLRKAPAVAA